MDASTTFAVGYFLVLGVWLVIVGVVVYHGWVFGSHPWVVRTRRRIFWHAIRSGMPYAWSIPAALPMGLGSIAWGVSTPLIIAQPDNGAAILLALLGFPLIFIPLILAKRRVRWFLAPWHRIEVEREEAGLEPLMQVPAEGPQMTITRRDMFVGLGLAVACVIAWWTTGSTAFLVGASTVLAFMGAMRLIGGHRDRRG
jgi:hypothetical protein